MDHKSLYPHTATLFAAICACIFVIIGVIGNLITILALLRSPKIRGHATTAFVLSLSISDLLFCSFSLPLTAIRFFQEKWTLGNTLCKMFPVIFYGNVAVSLLSMVGITLNRYILIACNRLYSKIYKTKYTIMQLALVWIISFALLLPPVFGVWGELGLEVSTFSCTILKKNGRSIKKTLFLVGFLLPCVVIMASYTCIYITVLRQKRAMKAHSSFEMFSKESVWSMRKQQEDHRLTIMMVTIFACFVLCFLPLMLANVVDDERNTSYPWFHIVSSVMAWASSVINPIIYAASNRNYRIAYCKVFQHLKFWEEQPTTFVSRSIHQCKNSNDISGAMRSTPLYHGVQKHDLNQICQTYSV